VLRKISEIWNLSETNSNMCLGVQEILSMREALPLNKVKVLDLRSKQVKGIDLQSMLWTMVKALDLDEDMWNR
jgi:hypothetical protein